MAHIKLGLGDWIVVCDGRKALLLQNAGDDVFPRLETRDVIEQANLSTRELGADAPGRAHQAGIAARSAVGQTDWHDEAERSFLAALAGRLDAAIRAGQIIKLNIAAPPRALGMIRPAYSPALRQALDSEIAKDLVKLPVYEIEKQLLG